MSARWVSQRRCGTGLTVPDTTYRGSSGVNIEVMIEAMRDEDASGAHELSLAPLAAPATVPLSTRQRAL